jgi:hypothetical protein
VERRLASEYSQTGATVEAEINPEGSQTSYEILLEGAVDTQRREGVLAAGFEPHAVTDVLAGLQPGSEYKYRVIATNSYGKAGWVGVSFVTCPADGPCPMQPAPGGEELWNIEGAERAAQEAPRLEAEREARQKEAEERLVKEAAERAAKERGIREAGERAGREAAERAAAAAHTLKCVVPRLRGDSLGAARRALRSAHCSLGKVAQPRTHQGSLVVVAQNVRGGRKLAKGAKVGVTLGTLHREHH